LRHWPGQQDATLPIGDCQTGDCQTGDWQAALLRRAPRTQYTSHLPSGTSIGAGPHHVSANSDTISENCDETRPHCGRDVGWPDANHG